MKQLIERMEALRSPVAAGLDTALGYLPDTMAKACGNPEDAARAILEFNCEIIDAVYKFVPAVKVQVAYYEMYGWAGMKTFAETLAFAKKRGMAVIADVKRNDIGSTAEAYSKAYISGVKIGGKTFTGFPADAVTANGYLGSDGIDPFVKDCADNGKGIFVLVKTSNKSGGQLQDKKLLGGRETVYETMAGLVKEWGAATEKYGGYNQVGAVVGATYPEQAAKLRKELPETLFLVPGYGAQGAGADTLRVFFNGNGTGAVINNSRGILLAYRSAEFKGLNYYKAAKAACEKMTEEIAKVLK